jgi:pyruvate formate lyase activating enzyme
MVIAGLQKMTLIDYPQKIAATVFTCGCNFRCGFCHNPELIKGNCSAFSEEKFFEFLKTRQNLLEGVCITGGEPTLQKSLPEFIKKIKELGFLVKLDTNGSNPLMLKNLLAKNLLDFVAMDIKSSPKKYSQVVGLKTDMACLQQSIDLIKIKSPDYEFRTTVVPGLVDQKDIEAIGKWLRGSKKYALQQFVPNKTYDPILLNVRPYTDAKLRSFKKIVSLCFEKVEIRGI